SPPAADLGGRYTTLQNLADSNLYGSYTRIKFGSGSVSFSNPYYVRRRASSSTFGASGGGGTVSLPRLFLSVERRLLNIQPPVIDTHAEHVPMRHFVRPQIHFSDSSSMENLNQRLHALKYGVVVVVLLLDQSLLVTLV